MKNTFFIEKGFTVIELIVVIAIIGILASIVIINVNSVRYKSRDATIKSDMSSFDVLALEYLQEHGNYGDFCGDSETEILFNAIPAFEEKKEKYCQHDSDEWFVCAQLNFPEDRSRAWCVDSTGVKKEIGSDDCKQGIKFCP